MTINDWQSLVHRRDHALAHPQTEQNSWGGTRGLFFISLSA